MCTLRRICVLICVKTKVSAKGFSCSVNVKRHKSCAYIRYSKPNVDMFCTFPVGLGCCVLKWWRIVMALCHHIEWVKAEQWNRGDMFSQKSCHHYSFSWTLSVVISIQKNFCIPKWNIFLPFFFFFLLCMSVLHCSIPYIAVWSKEWCPYTSWERARKFLWSPVNMTDGRSCLLAS